MTETTVRSPARASVHAGGRRGEQRGAWRRSQRTYASAVGWHVCTREGSPLGPYPSQFDADLVAALLIAQLEQATSAEACRRIVYNFRHDDRFRRVEIDQAVDENKAYAGTESGPR